MASSSSDLHQRSMRGARTGVCPHAPADPTCGVNRSIDKVAAVTRVPTRRSSSSSAQGFRKLKLPLPRPLSSLTVVPWNRVADDSCACVSPLPTQPKSHPRVNPTAQPRQSSLMRTLRQLHRISPDPLSSGGQPNDEQTSQARINTLKTLEEDTIPTHPSFSTPPSLTFGYSSSRLYDFWERLQVSHCGHYSVERMLALDEYCRKVSLVRVLAVCVLFPLGPLLVIMLTECLPLQPPEKGALANYVFWIRHTLMGTLLIVCAMAQAKVWIPEMSMSPVQVFIVALGSATVYTSLNILLADLWVFPIPFLIVAGAPLLLAIWALATRIALGPDPMEGIEDGGFRGRRFLMLTSIPTSLLGIYPAYQAVFLALTGILQLVAVAFMPALNLALKNLQMVWGRHLEDNLPELIVFTCDIFSTIYSVLCMHSANSMKMVAITVGINGFVVGMTLYGMNLQSRMARSYRSSNGWSVQQQLVERTLITWQNVDEAESLSTLVKATVKLLQVPGQLDSAELREIRLLSGMEHRLSKENTALLASLSARSVCNNERQTSKTVSIGKIKSQFSTASMEGRKRSSLHFVLPPQARSKMFQRLHAAVASVPVVYPRFKTKFRDRLWSSRIIRQKKTKNVATDSERSNTDTFPRLALQPLEATKSSTLRSSSLLQSSVQLDSSWTQHRKPSTTATSRSGMSDSLEISAKLVPVVCTSNPAIGSILEEFQKQNTRAVKQTLQLLFSNEYLGLTAYTQCFIPIVYLIYMPFLQRMPDHAYYPTYYRYFGDSRDFNDRMSVIAALAGLQLTMLAVLQAFVSKRFGISTIYQIAFVLESQFLFLQGRLLIWLIFAVQSTLVHYGADFTFQFAWVRTSAAS